jgi:DNA-binding transcriptional MerR regulator
MDKSPDAFRTISEVADEIDLPQHVLRFWETRFGQIRPLKRGGGRRYYRPEDVELLKGIRHLLYGRGYTIRGVQRILKSEGVRVVQAIGRGKDAERSRAGEEPSPYAADSAPGLPDADAAKVQPGAGQPGAPASGSRATVPDGPVPAGVTLPEHQLALLRGALEELVECERILRALDGNHRPPPDAHA